LILKGFDQAHSFHSRPSVADIAEAGLLQQESEPEEAAVERAFQFLLEDPEFEHGTRLTGELDMQTKKIIIDLYEQLTGKRLLPRKDEQ
jgi:hypothetical protein